MAEYVTKSELLSFAQENLNESRLRVAKASRQRNNANVFLSHSSKDKELMPGALALLEGHGGIVYTDEIDPEMPPYTSEETANKLKSHIKKNRKICLTCYKE